MALYQSGLMGVEVKEIHMMFNKYNLTRAGKYINLPKWISLKKTFFNTKKHMINVLSMLFSVVIIKYVQKLIQKTFIATKIYVEDDLHFDGINFPANNDTDNFEELNQNVSVSMFEADDENEQTVTSRKIEK